MIELSKMTKLHPRPVLISCLLFIAMTGVLSDLNSGTDDDEASLDSLSGGLPMEHKDEILNSLPRMPEEKPKELEGKLQIGIKKKAENCKHQAQKGDTLHMHYRGYLKEGGTEFDNSYKRGQPLIFTLGTGSVIKGWEQGLLGTCAGEKRKLVIPPHLGYGEVGTSGIPPKSTLVFEVETIKVESNREGEL